MDCADVETSAKGGNCLCPFHGKLKKSAEVWKNSLLFVVSLLHCPAVFGHFSPAP